MLHSRRAYNSGLRIHTSYLYVQVEGIRRRWTASMAGYCRLMGLPAVGLLITNSSLCLDAWWCTVWNLSLSSEFHGRRRQQPDQIVNAVCQCVCTSDIYLQMKSGFAHSRTTRRLDSGAKTQASMERRTLFHNSKLKQRPRSSRCSNRRAENHNVIMIRSYDRRLALRRATSVPEDLEITLPALAIN